MELRDAYVESYSNNNIKLPNMLSVAVISPYKSQVTKFRQTLGKIRQDLNNFMSRDNQSDGGSINDIYIQIDMYMCKYLMMLIWCLQTRISLEIIMTHYSLCSNE